MRRGTRMLALGLAVGTLAAACLGESDKGGVSPKAQAAVLTHTVDFAGGAVEPGDMPDPTGDVGVTDENEVYTLAPSEPAQILALGVDNSDDDPVTATLLQFEGAEDHIEVPAGPGADAGPVEAGVRVPFEIAPDACDDLCNQVYTVVLIEAVQLESGEISQRNRVTMELDCTKDGNPDQCSDEAAAAAIEPTSVYLDTLAEYQTAVCDCFHRGGATPVTDCGSFLGVDGECLAGVFEQHAEALGSQLDCAIDRLESLTTCFATAECNLESGVLPCGLDSSGTMAGMADCGAFPPGVQAEVDACIPALGMPAPSTDGGI